MATDSDDEDFYDLAAYGRNATRSGEKLYRVLQLVGMGSYAKVTSIMHCSQTYIAKIAFVLFGVSNTNALQSLRYYFRADPTAEFNIENDKLILEVVHPLPPQLPLSSPVYILANARQSWPRKHCMPEQNESQRPKAVPHTSISIFAPHSSFGGLCVNTFTALPTVVVPPHETTSIDLPPPYAP